MEHNYTTGYSTLFLDPFLQANKFFSVWQGIIDTDTFNVNQDNAQMIFYSKVDHNFTIQKALHCVRSNT